MTQVGAGYDVVAEDRRRDRRTLLVVLLVVVLLVGGVYAAGFVATSDRLPRGTEVGGVEVGGLTPARARSRVAQETAEAAARPIRLVVDDRAFRIRPDQVGLEVDVVGSVAQVPVGRSFDPRDMWEALVGGPEVPLQAVAVGDGLERRLARIADEVDEPLVEGGIELADGRARAVYPQVGRRLDQAAALEAVRAAYPAGSAGDPGDDPVLLDLVDEPPTVSSTEVSRAMREEANPAVSGPVTYRFGRGLTVVLGPDEIAGALEVVAVDGRLRLQVDPDRLWSLFGVVDSTYSAAVGEFRVGERVLQGPGVATYLREEVEAGFLAVVRQPQGQRVVSLPVTRLRGR